MEKIILKPLAKELVYKNGEDKTRFDVLSYGGSNGPEKLLGSLFVVGHIKYEEEDLAYAVSLISSLAKREYYSDISLGEQNAKGSFERTLKKLNEVLDDFFKNKNFKLNIGLVAISGDNIFISRLGKFKIALARADEYIDVLNNIDLFTKDTEDEKQFSNIISGKLKAGDKIFAYFPAKAVTLREKQLNGLFVKENQEEFAKKIEHLSANVANFSCCGVHIDIQQIKEIPVQTTVQYSMPAKAVTVSAKTDQKKEPAEKPPQASAQPRIISAELSVTKRANVFTPAIAGIYKMFSTKKLSAKTRSRNFIVIAAVAIIPLLVLIWFKNGASGEVRNALNKANENLKLAQTQIGKNSPREARALLEAVISGSIGISDKKIDTVKKEAAKILDGIDLINEKQPAIDETADKAKIFENVLPKKLAEIAAGGKSTALYEDNLYLLSESGTIIYKYADAAKGKSVKTLWGNLETPAIAITVDGDLYALSGDGKLAKFFKGKKSGEFDLQIVPSQGSKIFSDKNSSFLYLGDKIAKKVYVFDKSNGALKTTYKLDSIGTVTDISIAQDGTVWVLSANNKIWQIKP